MNVLDTLRAATPSRKTVALCVDGALQAEWDRLLDELDAAAKSDNTSGSLAMPATKAAVDALEEIRDKVAASRVTFEFERMPWTERLALQAAHPPREGNAVDRVRGFNIAAVYPLLIRGSCVAVTDVDGETVTEIPGDVWDGLLGTETMPGTFNTKQVDLLTRAVLEVNDGETVVPPSARSLLESQDSGAKLAQPGPGTSVPDGSTDGSPPGSPTSNGTATEELAVS